MVKPTLYQRLMFAGGRVLQPGSTSRNSDDPSHFVTGTGPDLQPVGRKTQKRQIDQRAKLILLLHFQV